MKLKFHSVNPKFSLALGIFAVSFASIFIKMSTSPSLVIATYRLAFGTISMAIMCFLTGQHRDFLKFSKKDFFLLLLSGFFLSLHFATWISSLKYIKVANSVVITDSSPIFVVFLSYIFLKEKISKIQMSGIAVTIFGGILIFLEDLTLQTNLFGDFLALAGAVTVAMYLIVGRNLRKKMNLFPYVSSCYFSAFIFLALYTKLFKLSFFGYNPREYILFFLLGVISSGIGHTAYNYALKYLKTSIVSVSILGEPVGASLLAALIFSEIPTIYTFIGGGMIIFGIWVAITERFK